MDLLSTFAAREELWQLQNEMKAVQAIQLEQTERLHRIERRQEEDSRTRSVWGGASPFPGTLAGTPQQGTNVCLDLRQNILLKLSCFRSKL